jgi:iron only hydrogenase large subunit-like protein
VAGAVANYIKENHPEVGDIPMHVAENLEECRKMMMLAKRGQYDGYLLEGMACPGGCIAGVGTIQPLQKSVAAVNLHKKVSTNQHSHQSDYQDMLEKAWVYDLRQKYSFSVNKDVLKTVNKH